MNKLRNTLQLPRAWLTSVACRSRSWAFDYHMWNVSN